MITAAVGASASAGALVVALGVLVGLGPLGWSAGALLGAGTGALLGAGMHRAGRRLLGPADRCTLIRAVLTTAVAVLAVELLAHGPRSGPAWWLVGLAALALVLDAVDGVIARRTGTASVFGARFDMEVDAALIMVLSVVVAAEYGGWVLLIGALRYGYATAVTLGSAAGARWLRRPLPPRERRRIVAAVQGVTLVVVAAGVLPAPLAAGATAVALAALLWSFAADAAWLYRCRSS